jgi:hypothetical protein
LASAGEDAQVTVWDVMMQEVKFQLPKVADWYSCIAFQPQCTLLATVVVDSTEVSLVPVNIQKKSGRLA